MDHRVAIAEILQSVAGVGLIECAGFGRLHDCQQQIGRRRSGNADILPCSESPRCAKGVKRVPRIPYYGFNFSNS